MLNVIVSLYVICKEEKHSQENVLRNVFSLSCCCFCCLFRIACEKIAMLLLELRKLKKLWCLKGQMQTLGSSQRKLYLHKCLFFVLLPLSPLACRNTAALQMFSAVPWEGSAFSSRAHQGHAALLRFL